MNSKNKTKIIHLSEVSKHKEEILETLRNGGVVLYPTDTQYGLGVVARNRSAVEKIAEIKKTGNAIGRGGGISIIVPNIAVADKCVFINDKARKLMDQHLPGALTLILPAKDKELARSRGNEQEIGIRIPDQKYILDIVSELGEPITTTSANISGQAPKTNCEDILADLSGIDLAIDGGELNGAASTIVRFAENENDMELIRQGSIHF